jgi:hypothetical protein
LANLGKVIFRDLAILGKVIFSDSAILGNIYWDQANVGKSSSGIVGLERMWWLIFKMTCRELKKRC